MPTAKRHISFFDSVAVLGLPWYASFHGRLFSFILNFMNNQTWNIQQFDTWCRSFLTIDALANTDDSLNGIQVGRSNKPITKVAFAVDACLESIRRAKELGANLLFVHHGLFWGKPLRIEGALLERIRLLVDNDIALYGCHLPLDMNPVVGNNAVLADLLSLQERKPYGVYHGVAIGVAGVLETPLTIAQIVSKILPDNSKPLSVIAAGKEKVSRVAIVSGGAASEVTEAFGTDIDLYLTGEPSHSMYHYVVENKLNFVAAGHYATEVWGVKAVARKLAAEAGIETVFIDLPTGL